ncbi:energy transducer TonB family protein [Endozoicomonas lisbonensis]|uniref:Protein TonB n=1 Tax=Endozoicomonas lisbonensis TaxID=3120522 RepID=A0ABV2SJU3_9GAMM
MNPLSSDAFSRNVIISLSLHLLLGIGLWKVTAPPPVLARLSDSLVVSSGMQAAIAGATAAQEVTEFLPPTEQIEDVSEEDDTELPEEEPLQEEESIEEPPLETVEEDIQEVEQEPIEQKEQEPENLPEEDPEPEEEQAEPEEIVEVQEMETEPLEQQIASMENYSGHEGVDGSRNKDPDEQDSGLGQEAGGSEQEVFDAHVRQHLLANKVTPNVLRRRQQSGTVTVEFTIDREGKLLEQGIARSSRVREFNRAAISLVRQAAPYPKAPPSADWEQRKYTINVVYSIQ